MFTVFCSWLGTLRNMTGIKHEISNYVNTTNQINTYIFIIHLMIIIWSLKKLSESKLSLQWPTNFHIHSNFWTASEVFQETR